MRILRGECDVAQHFPNQSSLKHSKVVSSHSTDLEPYASPGLSECERRKAHFPGLGIAGAQERAGSKAHNSPGEGSAYPKLTQHLQVLK